MNCRFILWAAIDLAQVWLRETLRESLSNNLNQWTSRAFKVKTETIKEYCSLRRIAKCPCSDKWALSLLNTLYRRWAFPSSLGCVQLHGDCAYQKCWATYLPAKLGICKIITVCAINFLKSTILHKKKRGWWGEIGSILMCHKIYI